MREEAKRAELVKAMGLERNQRNRLFEFQSLGFWALIADGEEVGRVKKWSIDKENILVVASP